MSKGDNFANGALVTRAGNAKKSSEELNGISESAQEQHEMELQALFDQLELEEGEEVQFRIWFGQRSFTVLAGHIKGD